MKLKHTSRDSLKKDNSNFSIKAVEGSLKKLFGFKKVPTDNSHYCLETLIKCKDFKVIIRIENLERLYVDIAPNRKFIYNSEHLTIFEGKYHYTVLRRFYNRYSNLK